VDTELHEYISEDKDFTAKVFLEEKGIYTVLCVENGERVDYRHFRNQSMAEYWADDCVIDYDLKSVAKRGEE
jgi:hypothetical protein